MKSLLLLTAATVGIAMSTLPADAQSKQTRSYYDQYAASHIVNSASYERRLRRLMRESETHDTVRANAADPTRQYDLPDWARAAFAGRGRR
jgi:hypothetical protein